MTLHQYFTLAFALHLNPLPTIDYVPVAGGSGSTDTDLSDSSSSGALKAGPTTRLESIVTNHPPHPIQTISFLLQYTKALESVGPWAQLIELLDNADPDPTFRNLREFFDARYDSQGRLIGSELASSSNSPRKPKRRTGSINRLKGHDGGLKQRESQAEDARKASFSKSAGTSSGLKMSWLRKNSSATTSVQNETEEESSDDGNEGTSVPARKLWKASSRASELHIPKRGNSVGSGGHHLEEDLKTVRFTVRLDLHNVGLAPAPPRPPSKVARRASRSNRLARSPESVNRAPSLSARLKSRSSNAAPAYGGGQNLSQVASPESMLSAAGISEGGYSIDAELAAEKRRVGALAHDESHFADRNDAPASPTKPRGPAPFMRSKAKLSSPKAQKTKEFSASTATVDSLEDHGRAMDDYGTSPDTSAAPNSSGFRSRKGSVVSIGYSANGNGPRRPSMIQRFLDFGFRKRSLTLTSSSDIAGCSSGGEDNGAKRNASKPKHSSSQPDPTSLSEGMQSLGVNGENRNDPPVLTPAEGHNHSEAGQHGKSEFESNDEALDLGEDDEDDPALAAGKTRALSSSSMPSRRRSSGGSGTRSGLGANQISVEPHLRPVQEDGAFDFSRLRSPSSAASMSASAGEESNWELDGVEADVDEHMEGGPKIAEGEDFLSLLRAAAEISLSVAKDRLEEDCKAADPDDSSSSPDKSVSEHGRASIDGFPSQKALGKRPESGGGGTPSRSHSTSRPSVELRRSPMRQGQDIEPQTKVAAFNDEEEEAWWPCGEVDPLPVSISCALSDALGWEGILRLCYGTGSKSHVAGDYLALGRAAAMEQKNKAHEKSVLAWRSNVASASASPMKETERPSFSAFASESDKTMAVSSNGFTPSQSEDPTMEAGERGSHGLPPGTELGGPDSLLGPAQEGLVTALRKRETLSSKDTRTWADWASLAQSIKGWVEEYETTRVRAGLAREIGVDPLPLRESHETGMDQLLAEDTDDTSALLLSANGLRVPRPAELSVSPLSHAPTLTKANHGDENDSDRAIQVSESSRSPPKSANPLPISQNHFTLSQPSYVQFGSSLTHNWTRRTSSLSLSSAGKGVVGWLGRDIPLCVKKDALNRAHGFRRRAGIPEGLPVGPDGEEFADYRWSRERLRVKHFATALTIGTDSLSHYLSQLSTSSWVHRSAWELDYLEMCVFKSPLVADRFPSPGESVVPSARSYRAPEDGSSIDRTKLCPFPTEDGEWDATAWKEWLSSIKEGDIIVPAVAWQAWWTLISVLNGADRSGRTYDLQVKTLDEPFEALTDLSAVYI
ncbi:hypothetical protein IE53DRAFT_368369 [Violaceomyces palustris]|uniref:Uncharacterized protein n=1 Tax=Violaceomyces palustris TaxID=1673888 RepID=A0ACD0NYZ2_9BASI|nr:hypothetical protein IE53DRAFT_368369 [Violaceomyces palustris]